MDGFHIFSFFSGAGVWRGAPKRPRLLGRKGNNEKGKGGGEGKRLNQENASDLLSTSKQESKAAQSLSFTDLVRGAHASSPASSSRRHWAKSSGTRRGEAGKMPPHAKWREKGAEGGKTFCASSTPVERLQPARS